MKAADFTSEWINKLNTIIDKTNTLQIKYANCTENANLVLNNCKAINEKYIDEFCKNNSITYDSY